MGALASRGVLVDIGSAVLLGHLGVGGQGGPARGVVGVRSLGLVGEEELGGRGAAGWARRLRGAVLLGNGDGADGVCCLRGREEVDGLAGEKASVSRVEQRPDLQRKGGVIAARRRFRNDFRDLI